MKKFHEESDGRWAANENLAFQEDDEHGPRRTKGNAMVFRKSRGTQMAQMRGA